MDKTRRYRELVREARRVVVKLGTRVLVSPSGKPDLRRMRSLIQDLVRLVREGRELAVVTSGAIGAGMEALGMKERPTQLPDLQMAAAVGQSRLMARYNALFGAYGYLVGQVLLTHADFQHRLRYTNARRTLENLLRHRVIPIINENDVVADEEIRADLALGDNDYLAALVTKMIRADLLILLTTVDGVQDRSPDGGDQRIACIETVTTRLMALASGSDSPLSKGGMATKLRAAHFVARAGGSVVIANGTERGVLRRIMAGEDVGTLILASAD